MRKLAREIAFKIIFESEFNEEFDVELSFVSAIENNSLSKEDELFAKELVELYFKNSEQILKDISSKAIGYEIDRIYKVDLALLKLAFCEIMYYKKTPAKVVVNEIIQLAKIYSSENSPKFINGVLSHLIEA